MSTPDSLETLRARTEQRLRFAQLHLAELTSAHSGTGDDFERAHLEAVLAQLFGAFDALLLELNVALRCGRSENDISLGKLRTSLLAQHRSSQILSHIYTTLIDRDSWLAKLQVLRHAAIHRRISLTFHLGGPKHRKVSFKHPESLEELPHHAEEIMPQWVSLMRNLIDHARLEASKETDRL
jgi:hypothetical protein